MEENECDPMPRVIDNPKAAPISIQPKQLFRGIIAQLGDQQQ
jgi:hypothetical protein